MSKHTEGKVRVSFATAEVMVITLDSEVDILAKCDCEIHSPETFANRDRIAALWNAADGKSNEDAVKALTHYEEMVSQLKIARDYLNESAIMLIGHHESASLNASGNAKVVSELLIKLNEEE